MPHSTRWSSASVPCRLEWRPSAWLAAALATLGVLAASALVASDLPPGIALPLAAVACGYGGWLARRELRRPSRQWVVPAVGEPSLDGEAMAGVEVRWRGPMAFLAWRDPRGRQRRLHWWPDTLPRARRRELRLVLQLRAATRAGTSMAP